MEFMHTSCKHVSQHIVPKWWHHKYLDESDILVKDIIVGKDITTHMLDTHHAWIYSLPYYFLFLFACFIFSQTIWLLFSSVMHFSFLFFLFSHSFHAIKVFALILPAIAERFDHLSLLPPEQAFWSSLKFFPEWHYISRIKLCHMPRVYESKLSIHD